MSELLVVSLSRWRADDLGGRHVWPFDLPDDVPPGTDIWCPGQVAATWQVRAARPPVLRSLGREWPAHLPAEVDPGPERTLIAAGAAIDFPGRRFVKLADAKDDRFPAAVRTATETRRDLAAVGETELLVAAEREFDAEVRVFASSAGTSASTYRLGEDYYDSGRVEPALPSGFRVPPLQPGTVWDFGRRACDGGWEVIEYNAPWSSSWYGCDVAVVRAAITDARTLLPPWRPDRLYLDAAARRA